MTKRDETARAEALCLIYAIHYNGYHEGADMDSRILSDNPVRIIFCTDDALSVGVCNFIRLPSGKIHLRGVLEQAQNDTWLTQNSGERLFTKLQAKKQLVFFETQSSVRS